MFHETLFVQQQIVSREHSCPGQKGPAKSLKNSVKATFRSSPGGTYEPAEYINEYTKNKPNLLNLPSLAVDTAMVMVYYCLSINGINAPHVPAPLSFQWRCAALQRKPP